jgi:DNA-binding CsgD family transcriptional regulator
MGANQATSDTLARLDEWDNAAWSFMSDRLKEGFAAVALTAESIDRPMWPPAQLYNDEVEVEVKYRQEGAQRPSMARIRLTDAVGLVEAGADILEVGAPRPRPPVFYAMACVQTGSFGHLILVQDERGFGRLGMSTAPSPTGSPGNFGHWYRQVAARSGVPQENERRTAAVRHLFQEYGEKEARALVQGVQMDTMAVYTEEHPQVHVWEVAERLIAAELTLILARSKTPKKPAPTMAGAICDALSTEAYGAKRPGLMEARSWAQRYDCGDKNNPDRFPNVTYEAVDAGGSRDSRHDPALGYVRPGTELHNRPGRIQVLSEWTLLHSGPDPVGEMASGLRDGTVTISGAATANASLGQLVAQWRLAGLTDRQVQVLYAHQVGLTEREIADKLEIAPSTVADALAAARKKIF